MRFNWLLCCVCVLFFFAPFWRGCKQVDASSTPQALRFRLFLAGWTGEVPTDKGIVCRGRRSSGVVHPQPVPHRYHAGRAVVAGCRPVIPPALLGRPAARTQAAAVRSLPSDPGRRLFVARAPTDRRPGARESKGGGGRAGSEALGFAQTRTSFTSGKKKQDACATHEPPLPFFNSLLSYSLRIPGGEDADGLADGAKGLAAVGDSAPRRRGPEPEPPKEAKAKRTRFSAIDPPPAGLSAPI